MIDELTIRQQYSEYEKEFEKTKENLWDTLDFVARSFYQQTKFRVLVDKPRIKSVESLVGKLKRKSVEANSLFVKREDILSLVVNDFIGARIICGTRDDVKEIADMICGFPRFRIQGEPDHKHEISGYRALHLDLLYRDYWKEELVFIPIEIQIKTQLQNAWANIVHDEFYKPENEELKENVERDYARHMADILDNLDDMASTIREHRLRFVMYPSNIIDSDTLINSKTLSFKVKQIKDGRLTQQEMTLAIGRLKEEGFESLEDVTNLLNDPATEKLIKQHKEKLRNEENVQPFEILYYGSILKRGKKDKFVNEMMKDFGFVNNQCLDCGKLLTQDEYTFIKTKTDSDTEYYCAEHQTQHFNKQCEECGTLTTKNLCKNCEAKITPI